MKRTSRLAIFSFALALLGFWIVWIGGPWVPLIGVPLGLVAAGLGAGAIRSVRQGAEEVRGRGLAIVAVCLGLLTLLASAAAFISFVSQQFSNPPQRWQSNRSWAELGGENRMPDESAANFSSSLPVIVLDTAGQSITKNRARVVRAQFFDSVKGRASVAAKPGYDGLATLNIRGYSTLHLPKHSYTLHTVDRATNQIDVPLLGMPAEADWVLYAPYEDKTLIRDVLAYDLARSMGHYAPRTQFVELFIRSSQGSLSMRDYEGVYVLTEKIKRGKNRVPVAKLEAKDRTEPDISGGYILKRDHSDGPGARFRTSHGGPYFYIYPKPDKITSEQKRWIREYLQTFESTLESPEFDDPQHGYARFLDVDSFIDAHWLIELGKNVDGFRYSAFLSKDRDGKLKPEPPWDWNRSFGNANYYGGGQPRGWYWTNLRPNEINWYRRLRQDPAFARRCTARWRELRQGAFDPKRISGRIDELAAQLAGAQKRNFQRWPVLGHQVTCNYYVGDSFEAEVQWLKKWIDHRIAWIDQQVAKVSDN